MENYLLEKGIMNYSDILEVVKAHDKMDMLTDDMVKNMDILEKYLSKNNIEFYAITTTIETTMGQLKNNWDFICDIKFEDGTQLPFTIKKPYIRSVFSSFNYNMEQISEILKIENILNKKAIITIGICSREVQALLYNGFREYVFRGFTIEFQSGMVRISTDKNATDIKFIRDLKKLIKKCSL